MATLTTRLGKGSPVSFKEMDSNLLALDSDSPFRVAAGHIGYNGKVVLGPDGDSLGYVPTYDLDFGYGDLTNTYTIGGSTDVNWHIDNGKEFRILNDGAENFTMLGNGNIGIGGENNPIVPLQVNGNIQTNATVTGVQGFFTSVYDGTMTISGGSVFNGINADYSGQISFGTLNDGAVNPMIGFEIGQIDGSAVLLPSSSAVRYSLDSEHDWAVYNFDSEHQFNVRTHFVIDSTSIQRDDSDHQWANQNFDSSHNWAINNFDSEHSWARDDLDSEHNWANNTINALSDALDSALDSEHAWNVVEQNQLQINIDSQHLYTRTQDALLNLRADSEHAWANANFDSEHNWSVTNDNVLRSEIDSDHLWAVRKFDSEHGWSIDNFDSEHFWAKAYIESTDSASDSELRKQIRILNSTGDSEHAWNVAEHAQLQQSLDSEHDLNVNQRVALESRVDSRIDSDHAWAVSLINTTSNQSQTRDDSDHSWAAVNFNRIDDRIDSEHAWNVSEHDSAHNRMLATVDSDHQWANGLFTSLLGGGDSEHIYSVRENTLLNARADSEHAWNVTEHAGIDARLDSNDTNFTARARGTISLTDAGGDGSASYNAATGVITYTGPSAAEVRAHFTGGNGITYTAASGDIAQTARTINTVSYNGTANIVVEPFVERDDATAANRPITFVDDTTAGHKRLNMDANLTYNPSTNIMGTSVSGNAATATILQTARTINTVSFNGSAAIVVEPFVERDDASNATRRLTFVDDATAGHKRLNMDTALTFNPSTGTLTSTNYEGTVNGGTFP